jgi:tRNA(Ile)-lysidine synthase
MTARKKLSDYFTDRKIPAAEKPHIPLLVTGGDIVWVCGERLDDRFRVREETRNVLQLRFEPGSR